MNPLYIYIKKRLTAVSYAGAEAAALAKYLLTEVFNLSSLELYTGKDTVFPPEKQERLDDILTRLERFEPIQYITGKAWFDGLCFEVNPSVLIPRPETEELVEWIASDYPAGRIRILDIGTGSGCIPVALARRLPEVTVTSWDVSDEALAVARRNAERNGVTVGFFRVDVLGDDFPASDIGRIDVLVSNPPYITEKEQAEMERNVLDYEPGLALFVPDEEPLRFYIRIAEAGKRLLTPGGALYFEINRAYGRETMEMLQRLGYHDIELRKDLSGNDRMIKAKYHENLYGK